MANILPCSMEFGALNPRALVRAQTYTAGTKPRCNSNSGQWVVCSGAGSGTGDRIIFLDIDGVLHLLRKGKQHAFDPDCMANLRHVVTSTGARIVLSSSWRCAARQLERVHEALVGAGIEEGVYDTTPVRGFSNNRVGEITDWLARHSDVGAYVAIDDMDLSTGKQPGGSGGSKGGCAAASAIAGNVIRTNPSEGLTSSLAEEAIAILTSTSRGGSAGGGSGGLFAAPQPQPQPQPRVRNQNQNQMKLSKQQQSNQHHHHYNQSGLQQQKQQSKQQQSKQQQQQQSKAMSSSHMGRQPPPSRSNRPTLTRSLSASSVERSTPASTTTAKTHNSSTSTSTSTSAALSHYRWQRNNAAAAATGASAAAAGVATATSASPRFVFDDETGADDDDDEDGSSGGYISNEQSNLQNLIYLQSVSDLKKRQGGNAKVQRSQKLQAKIDESRMKQSRQRGRVPFKADHPRPRQTT